jgi:hypothetical protein
VGSPLDVQYARGLPVHLVTSNAGTNAPLQVGQPIELAFDRLLLPITVTRQTFVLVDKAAESVAITFAIAYDPVARVVTLTPVQALSVGHSYEVTIESPNNPTDSSGLHAIDGATMDPNTARTVTFQVVVASGTPPATCNGIVGPCMSFCTDILPIFQGNCVSGTCHNAKPPPPLGLALYDPPDDTAAIVELTAINRLSVESTMGALSEPGPPSFHFGQDMPIIDTTTVTDPNTSAPVGPTGSGDPGDSFLIFKVLMAGTGGLPLSGVTPLPSSVYSVAWEPLSDGERATLASLIPGREMPLPTQVSSPQPNPNGLPVDSLERLSLWIAQGAPLSTCP